ncbi:ABC transporter permease [Virgibacillus litoralis]|uniref:ABC-2 type transport system permease protein n=1 Tax=Virgibacillus litoralis TaxID=578221 RepID=A0ABS4HAG0_9BACI|nr:ABC transporter permease [Virgibacillus litoralis]MBP1947734.1 ABC-2 type transport system permease protein [Virgibacillus litoralis]
MHFIKHLFLFTNYNIKQLQRKWLTLPLLLLFPIILVSFIAIIAVSVFTPEEKETIYVGLIDLDKSDETELVLDLMEESSQLGSYIQIKKLTKEQAIHQIDGQLSAYVTFPEGFTESLYNGNQVTLNITGNPNKRTESYVVKELLDSITRHIRASQANILTINYYAKQLSIDNETRQDMLFNQFTNFLVYTVGKDKIIDEEKITNNATDSPVHYYGLSSWFTIITAWLLVFYSFFTKDEEYRIMNRMRLYGVTQIRQVMAKILTAFALTTICAIITLLALTKLIDVILLGEDYLRIAVIISLYSISFLFGLAILETVISGPKIRLLSQSLFAISTLLVSGAIIPTLYFPLYAQKLLPYSFAGESFRWLQEVVLNGRLYADYLPLSLLTIASFLLLIGLSMWKERVNQ